MIAVSEMAAYPVPSIQEALSLLQGGKVFSTLGFAQAYQHLRVTLEKAAALTVNTLKGMLKFNRFPFGMCATLAIFQRFMDMTPSGIPGANAYPFDIVVSGARRE